MRHATVILAVVGSAVLACSIIHFPPSAHAAHLQARVFPGTEWLKATPESQGLAEAELRAAVDYMEREFGPDGARELVLVRNGYLIWAGPNADACHNIWSATKNFTSTALGLLVADGKTTADTRAVNHLPALDDQYPLYARITMRHLASMCSGYKGEVVDVTDEQPWGNPMAYLNPTAPLFEPGTRVQYHDHQVFLLGSIVTRLSGEPLQALFKRRIADPISMTHWDWGISGKLEGIDLNNAAGTPSRSPGVQTNARELARFGLLYLNQGRWKERQLLPASFVLAASSNQVPATGASAFLHGRYGFYWWTNDRKPDGKRPWPAAPPRTCTSHGHSANFCFIIPEWNMVIVRLGTIPIVSGVSGLAKVEAKWNAFFERLAGSVEGADAHQSAPPE
jgi:CubicO group peptidase (beta-lactamase class C family)